MKLKFWKREPEINFDKLKEELSAGSTPSDSLGLDLDRTAGLGGTGRIENASPRTEMTLNSDPFHDAGEGVIRGRQDYLRELPSKTNPAGSSPDMLLKDVEIISSKLDTIKAMVESINQRLDQLERQGRDAYKRW